MPIKIKLEATAAAKEDPRKYTWFTYTGRRTLEFEDVNKNYDLHVHKDDEFGIRAMRGNLNYIVVIPDFLDEKFKLPHDKAVKLLKQVKAFEGKVGRYRVHSGEPEDILGKKKPEVKAKSKSRTRVVDEYDEMQRAMDSNKKAIDDTMSTLDKAGLKVLSTEAATNETDFTAYLIKTKETHLGLSIGLDGKWSMSFDVGDGKIGITPLSSRKGVPTAAALRKVEKKVSDMEPTEVNGVTVGDMIKVREHGQLVTKEAVKVDVVNGKVAFKLRNGQLAWTKAYAGMVSNGRGRYDPPPKVRTMSDKDKEELAVFHATSIFEPVDSTLAKSTIPKQLSDPETYARSVYGRVVDTGRRRNARRVIIVGYATREVNAGGKKQFVMIGIEHPYSRDSKLVSFRAQGDKSHFTTMEQVPYSEMVKAREVAHDIFTNIETSRANQHAASTEKADQLNLSVGDKVAIKFSNGTFNKEIADLKEHEGKFAIIGSGRTGRKRWLPISMIIKKV
jgi:hypothetical protein